MHRGRMPSRSRVNNLFSRNNFAKHSYNFCNFCILIEHTILYTIFLFLTSSFSFASNLRYRGLRRCDCIEAKAGRGLVISDIVIERPGILNREREPLVSIVRLANIFSDFSIATRNAIAKTSSQMSRFRFGPLGRNERMSFSLRYSSSMTNSFLGEFGALVESIHTHTHGRR